MNLWEDKGRNQNNITNIQVNNSNNLNNNNQMNSNTNKISNNANQIEDQTEFRETNKLKTFKSLRDIVTSENFARETKLTTNHCTTYKATMNGFFKSKYNSNPNSNLVTNVNAYNKETEILNVSYSTFIFL